ncbi:MAG: tetratricopeptide repeat protein, partial [Myxococcales bacterium]|nr:tetratricopeptide repeat protein [Myxococcales bacterium]
VREALALDANDAESWFQLGLVQRAGLRADRLRERETTDSRHAEAIATFDKVDALAGGHVAARIEKAHVYAGWKGHDAQALETYRSAIRLARERGNRRHWQMAALALDEYARATGRGGLRAEALQELVSADPSRIRAWEQLAALAERREGPGAADRIYAALLAQQPDQVAAHIVYTSHLARQKRGMDAIAHLNGLLSEGLDAAALWEQLIRLELSEGMREDARATLQRMRALHPDDPMTHTSAARLASADGRYAEALEHLDALAARDPSAELEQLRALAHSNLGNVNAALAAIEKAVALSRGFPISAKQLEASIRHEARQWQATLDVLDALEQHRVALTPAERLMRARALYELGKRDEGRRALDALLGESVATPGAALEFSRREGARRPEEAKRELAKALRDAPGSHELLVAITRLDLQAGQAERALQRLDRVVESQPADAEILLLRAELLARAGQLGRAEIDALRAFEANPNLPGASDLLFSLYERQGKLGEALRSFEEADSVGVLHGSARALFARLYQAQGRTREAREIYERVIRDDPAMLSAKQELATLLASEGREIERAVALAEEAQRALPDDPDAWHTLGFAELRAGRPEPGLEHLRGAIARAEARRGEAPATFHYHAGLALSALERSKEAADAFERALAIDPDFPEADVARRELEALRRGSASSSS